MNKGLQGRFREAITPLFKKGDQKCTSKLPSCVVDFSMQQSDGAHNPQSYHQTHGQIRIIS